MCECYYGGNMLAEVVAARRSFRADGQAPFRMRGRDLRVPPFSPMVSPSAGLVASFAKAKRSPEQV